MRAEQLCAISRWTAAFVWIKRAADSNLRRQRRRSHITAEMDEPNIQLGMDLPQDLFADDPPSYEFLIGWTLRGSPASPSGK